MTIPISLALLNFGLAALQIPFLPNPLNIVAFWISAVATGWCLRLALK